MASSQSWSTMFQYSPSQVPIFAGQRYIYWRKQMETLFVSQDLWDVIDESCQEQPTGEKDKLKHEKELKKKEASALRFIQQGVSESIYEKIADCKKAKDAWKILEDEFKDKEKEEVQAGDSEWILDITVMLASLKNKQVKACSISRVSDKLRQGIKEEADHNNDMPKIDPYSPNVVSMGPFHKETRSNDLQLMEETKWSYMRKILFRDRTVTIMKKIENCSEEIRKIDTIVRASYGGTGNLDSKPEELARMMLLDGCFFLELLLRFYESTLSTVDDNNNDRFGDFEILPVLTDLTLLENQIPFIVLETILKRVSPGTNIFPQFHKLLDTLFHYNLESSPSVFHFLHLLHSIAISDDDKQSYHETSKEKGSQLKRCAARLMAYGIKIQPLDTETHTVASALSKYMDKFDLRIDLKRGKLKIPPLRIKVGTEVRWRNLIALEQSRIGIAYKFTSLAMFFKGLICSVHDISLLKEREVIIVEDPKIKDKDLLVMFQSIINGVERMDDRYSKLCESLNTKKIDVIGMKYGRLCSHYCRLVLSWLSKVFKSLMRTFINVYSPNLWAFVGVAAATVLLVLTIMQTYYAARSS